MATFRVMSDECGKVSDVARCGLVIEASTAERAAERYGEEYEWGSADSMTCYVLCVSTGVSSTWYVEREWCPT